MSDVPSLPGSADLHPHGSRRQQEGREGVVRRALRGHGEDPGDYHPHPGALQVVEALRREQGDARAAGEDAKTKAEQVTFSHGGTEVKYCHSFAKQVTVIIIFHHDNNYYNLVKLINNNIALLPFTYYT